MNVWETDPHMREHLGGIVGMRVLPMNCRNIRNIIYINKNIHKKQIDNRNLIITDNRNIPERPGTFLPLLFRQCSGYPVFRNIATGLVNQALQPISEKSCSGLFRLQSHSTQQGGNPSWRGFTAIPLFIVPDVPPNQWAHASF
ncbi:hypothetical protein ACAW55_16250 [Pseudomonas sp. Env-94]